MIPIRRHRTRQFELVIVSGAPLSSSASSSMDVRRLVTVVVPHLAFVSFEDVNERRLDARPRKNIDNCLENRSERRRLKSAESH